MRPLKTVWQIRFSDASRSPQRTTNIIPKSEYSEREANWRQQLYDRGKYDPWTQNDPDDAAEAAATDHLTLHDAVEQYMNAKREAGRLAKASLLVTL